MNTATEHAFERRVEEILLRQGGWRRVANAEWEAERALFPARICAFLEATQPKLWAQMRALHADGLESLLAGALARELDLKGTLHVLRHGFKFYGKTFRMAWFKPAHALNEEVLALYGKNELTITRQAPCHPKKHDTVDLLFALNGLPVATCELKNPGTGQSWRHAVRQYRNDRDPRAPLFRFKARALVHFAADPNEVHMSTRIGGAETRFLPFNRGSHPGEVRCGAGNPRHPSGYRTGYFWEEVLERDSFLDVLGHFMFIETKDEKVDDGKGGVRRITRETLIFPRYHQLDAVRKLIAAAREEGSGRNYLIQHSAGSGKTNSISWLSHRLASLHDREDRKVFDCVVVITDRRVLDRQLQDAIYQIEHTQGVVKAIDRDSRQLAAALIDGTRIVVTTRRWWSPLHGCTRCATSSPSSAMKHALDLTRIYHWSEVEAFARIFYKPSERQDAVHGGRSSLLRSDQGKSLQQRCRGTDGARQSARQVRDGRSQPHRGPHDRTHGRERSDRDALHVGQGISGFGVPRSRPGDLRDRAGEAGRRGSRGRTRRCGRAGVASTDRCDRSGRAAVMPRKITKRPFCNLSRLDPPKRPDDPGAPGLLHGSAWQA